MTTPEDRPIDRSTADRILQRALELDAQRADALTELQLREIAAEMSLSRLALDTALEEYRSQSGTRDRLTATAPGSSVPWYWIAGAGFTTLLVVVMMSLLFPGL